MKPLRHGSRRRLALAAVGAAVAMVLLPSTAAAQLGDGGDGGLGDIVEDITGGGDDDSSIDPLGENNLNPLQRDDDSGNNNVGPALVPRAQLPVVDDINEVNDDTDEDPPEVNDGLEVTEDDDSEGHETDDPAFPDHGSGEVGDLNVGDEEQFNGGELTEYGATAEDDDSTRSEANLFGLFDSEFVSSEADSDTNDGDDSDRSNPAEPFCEASGGALCLNLFYTEATASQDDGGSSALGRGGLAGICLGGDDEDALGSYECSGPISAGAAEGIGGILRSDDGETRAGSANELLNLCLGNSDDGAQNFAEDQNPCSGFRTSVLHSDSASDSDDEQTSRNSWFIGFSNDGDEIFRFEDTVGSGIPPGCGDAEDGGVGLLCAFVNQGESYLVTDDEGAGSAQEAGHLDLLEGTPLDITTHSGNAETVVRDQGDNDGDGDGDGDNGNGDNGNGDNGNGDNGDQPECNDGIDNDGDGHIDFGDDPQCDSPQDDSEAPVGKGVADDGGAGDRDDGAAGAVDGGDDGDLAFTGFNTAPMLATAFALIGVGALTMAATRRKTGEQV